MLLGLTNYAGDVAESLIEIKETKLGAGIFFRYHFSNRFALKTHLYTGNISGTDANAKSPGLLARSFQFRSNLLEISMVGEWNVFNIKPVQRNGIQNLRIVPYLYFGIGGVLMHPRVVYYGPLNDYDAHVKYPIPENGLSSKALIIPIGGGLRAQITDRITLGAEGGWRPVFSDQLDGVSRNGNPDRNDWFYTAIATLSYALTR